MKSRLIRRAGQVTHMRDNGNAYKVLVLKKKPLARPRHRWTDITRSSGKT
jgi:hypothetical protein